MGTLLCSCWTSWGSPKELRSYWDTADRMQKNMHTVEPDEKNTQEIKKDDSLRYLV